MNRSGRVLCLSITAINQQIKVLFFAMSSSRSKRIRFHMPMPRYHEEYPQPQRSVTFQTAASVHTNQPAQSPRPTNMTTNNYIPSAADRRRCFVDGRYCGSPPPQLPVSPPPHLPVSPPLPTVIVTQPAVIVTPPTPRFSPEIEVCADSTSIQRPVRAQIEVAAVPGLDVWYVIEKAEGCVFTTLCEVQEPCVEVVGIPRGTLHKFRYRVANDAGVSAASPCTTTLVDYPAAPDAPCDLEVQPLEEFQRIFLEDTLLGKGHFGLVKIVKVKDSDEKYAAKYLNTNIEKKREAAYRELDILRRLSHDKLLKVYSAYADRKTFIIVTEILCGGELFERLVDDENVTEGCVVQFVRQICEGMLYLHHQRVAHLDLKAENIMCVSPNTNQIKIIDFGLARIIDGTPFRTIYGTRDYVAPEIISYDPISLKTDMWSVGVITYLALSGLLPFGEDCEAATDIKIQLNDYSFDDEAFDNISDLAKDFIDGLLKKKPNERMSARECLQHPWIADEHKNIHDRTALEIAKDNLRLYLASYRSKWHKAGHVILATRRLLQRNPRDARACPGPSTSAAPSSFDDLT